MWVVWCLSPERATTSCRHHDQPDSLGSAIFRNGLRRVSFGDNALDGHTTEVVRERQIQRARSLFSLVLQHFLQHSGTAERGKRHIEGGQDMKQCDLRAKVARNAGGIARHVRTVW